jgi:ABC-2 type transport system ATP-binding protein
VAEPARGNVVSTDALTMEFGKHRALDSLTLEIGGGVTGLVGANGAGKTTLFNILLGLMSPSSGHAKVAGLDPISDGAAVRARIGFSPERNVLPDEMQAYEFVRHLAEVRGLPKSEARSRASDALWLVGLGEERFRALGTMSTGQRQRVKLAQALASDPKLIFLDEPTDGLDPVQRDEMLELIGSIHDEFAIDVIVSSHVLEEVERVCDSVVVLDQGRCVLAGSVAELLAITDNSVEVELVEVHDDGSVAAVERWITNAGHSVTRDGTTLTINGDSDDVFDVARDAVAATGARVRRFGTRRTSLEEVFITAGTNAEGPAPYASSTRTDL